MMHYKNSLLCYCFVFLSCCTNAQSIIKGVVYDDSTHLTIEAASVFLSNTSFGTTTNNKGDFKLVISRPGKYMLVISSIGYNTFSKMISLNNDTTSVKIFLSQKSNQLQDVVITNSEKDGWIKYGNLFLNNFIGTSKEARQCILKNKSVVKFSFSQQKHQLVAFADEPLIIENKALGYIIKYQLENFIFRYDSSYLSFEGYPLFIEMDGNVRKQYSWQKARKEAYDLSIMRFIRALYDDKVIENNYAVFRLRKNAPNMDKQKLQQQESSFDSTFLKSAGNIKYESTLSSAGLANFKKIMAEPDSVDAVSHTLLTADSIVYNETDSVKILSFPDYLVVSYLSQKIPLRYAWVNRDAKDTVYSILRLVNNKPVAIYKDGSYDNIQDLLYEGFWAWWQRLATMLPFDFELSEPHKNIGVTNK